MFSLTVIGRSGVSGVFIGSDLAFSICSILIDALSPELSPPSGCPLPARRFSGATVTASNMGSVGSVLGFVRGVGLGLVRGVGLAFGSVLGLGFV